MFFCFWRDGGGRCFGMAFLRFWLDLNLYGFIGAIIIIITCNISLNLKITD